MGVFLDKYPVFGVYHGQIPARAHSVISFSDRRISNQLKTLIRVDDCHSSASSSRNGGARDREGDMEVLDEPLYPSFLRVTGFDRPYREEILSKIESDGNKVVNEVIFGPGGKKYRYCKHMAKQRLPGLPDDLMKKGKHIILIRNPLDILPSFDKVVPPSFKELGLADLVTIYSELCELGKSPVIVDAADLQQDPEATLRSLCEDLDIPFQATMLRWEAGPKPIDGLWAKWWRNVRKTSSLLKSPLPEPDLPVPANKNLLAWVGDEIVPRDDAKVSVFDSIVQGGDGVWEGLRVYNGKVFKLEEHLDRLFDSAKALAFNNIPTREEVKQAIFRTLIRNGMLDNAHIRLTLTQYHKVLSHEAITEIGEVIQFYDSDRRFPAWGFGGKTFDGTVSHCFNLNGRAGGFEVDGVEGIMAAYASALNNVSLAGPTLFGQVINTAARIAGQSLSYDRSKYFVLLIITDGVLKDLQETKDALVRASDLPLSILIVGVGGADFTQMEILDADNGRRLESSTDWVATRDIVQFVPMREVHSGQISVVQALLEELPGQFLTYMRCRDIKPLNVQMAQTCA
ncbi:Branched-chain-amino-acid aminotransferase-like protein 1 [Citrus sinensis]|nr:Branched-chain-amino-acid aminotransferase-like protein 1 [Citrus sinensis]